MFRGSLSDFSTEDHRGAAGTGRLLALDVFRGSTIAGMILVNNAGNWERVHWPLEHAKWHGWTPTDLIFPFFLFIVGVSITLALARRVERVGSKRDQYLKILRRTLIIFALGLFIQAFPFFKLSTLRIPGVLQRIAVCYFFTSIIFLNTKWRTQAAIAGTLLVGYWLLMTLVPAPGFAAGDLTREGSLASFVDRKLLAGHIYTKDYDPEGLLSTVPALATTLCGVLAGHWLRSRRTQLEQVTGMFIAGLASVVAGWVWNAWFPINKALWTSSYVLFTAGMALQFLALCYWLIELKNYRRWATPFVIFGVNSIAVYVLSALLGRLMPLWQIARADGSMGNIKSWTYEHLFASWTSPVNASLLWAISYVLLWLCLMWLLYRKKILVKI